MQSEQLESFLSRANHFCDELDLKPVFVAARGTDELGAYADVVADTEHHIFRLRPAQIVISSMGIKQEFSGVAIENPPYADARFTPKPFSNLSFVNPSDFILYIKNF